MSANGVRPLGVRVLAQQIRTAKPAPPHIIAEALELLEAGIISSRSEFEAITAALGEITRVFIHDVLLTEDTEIDDGGLDTVEMRQGDRLLVFVRQDETGGWGITWKEEEFALDAATTEVFPEPDSYTIFDFIFRGDDELWWQTGTTFRFTPETIRFLDLNDPLVAGNDLSGTHYRLLIPALHQLRLLEWAATVKKKSGSGAVQVRPWRSADEGATWEPLFAGGSEPALASGQKTVSGTGFEVTELDPNDILRFDLLSVGNAGGLEFTMRGKIIEAAA